MVDTTLLPDYDVCNDRATQSIEQRSTSGRLRPNACAVARLGFEHEHEHEHEHEYLDARTPPITGQRRGRYHFRKPRFPRCGTPIVVLVLSEAVLVLDRLARRHGSRAWAIPNRCLICDGSNDRATHSIEQRSTSGRLRPNACAVARLGFEHEHEYEYEYLDARTPPITGQRRGRYHFRKPRFPRCGTPIVVLVLVLSEAVLVLVLDRLARRHGSRAWAISNRCLICDGSNDRATQSIEQRSTSGRLRPNACAVARLRFEYEHEHEYRRRDD
ncbi:hypothetical protein [Allorhodopirellula solitaria]|uniref:hypothetical protein n=1 Tax=Allorhodopirellula solitaria TaxID=2527987 RepID=UPI0011B7F992|nr:hypothetical protein [Allorhodopirellula solitaria]